MTKIEFLLTKCNELSALADTLADIDEETGETFESMAHVLKTHIQCLDRKPDWLSDYKYAINCVGSTVAKLQAIDALYNLAALKTKPGMGGHPMYENCIKCWKSFFEVDLYPFTENDPERPTTMQGVMGSMSPSAYD